jgi:hypothetical protein
MTKGAPVNIKIDAAPKGEWKSLGGGDRDEWNNRLSSLVLRALPINHGDTEAVSVAGSAAAAGTVDMKPADPIEGMLISQLVVANEAALKMYDLAWLNNAEYFEASTKYLQLAHKFARTVALLSERLDHHRSRGQQQIVVKHVTVNADQALVTDQIVAGSNNRMSLPSLVKPNVERPMEKLDEGTQTEPAIAGGDTKSK